LHDALIVFFSSLTEAYQHSAGRDQEPLAIFTIYMAFLN